MLSLTLPPARSRFRRAVGVLAAIALLFGMSAARASAAQVAYGSVDRLVQSTGNLYWTSHYFDGQHNQLSVWRTAKTASPGDERALWQENAATSDRFGALTYANVAGTWYGYFVDNFWAGALGGPGTRVSVIKRVPLAGGPAVALRTTDNPFLAYTQLPGVVGQNDLVTDGVYLYWADSQAVRRMPIGGGSVSTLANGTALGHVALDDSYVYYTSGTTIRRVGKTGGASTIIEDGGISTITAMTVVPGTPTTVYWAMNPLNGFAAIYSKALDGSLTQTRWYSDQAPATITSIAVNNDQRVYFSACYPQLNNRCRVAYQDPGLSPYGTWHHLLWQNLPHDVQGDGGSAYWANSQGIVSSGT